MVKHPLKIGLKYPLNIGYYCFAFLWGQGHLTEKLMSKLQNLYDIALEQNVEWTVHQSTKQ